MNFVLSKQRIQLLFVVTYILYIYIYSKFNLLCIYTTLICIIFSKPFLLIKEVRSYKSLLGRYPIYISKYQHCYIANIHAHTVNKHGLQYFITHINFNLHGGRKSRVYNPWYLMANSSICFINSYSNATLWVKQAITSCFISLRSPDALVKLCLTIKLPN